MKRADLFPEMRMNKMLLLLNILKKKKKKTVIWVFTEIMASCPITSWQTDAKTVETVTNFILGGSKNHW